MNYLDKDSTRNTQYINLKKTIQGNRNIKWLTFKILSTSDIILFRTSYIVQYKKIIFNNTEIVDLDVKKLVGLSLYDLMREKDKICNTCDLRPVIIDSNEEGIILVSDSGCNETVGQIINILIIQIIFY